MSSLASLTAVISSTKVKGTAVVNQGREDTLGISCQHINTHAQVIKYSASVGLFTFQESEHYDQMLCQDILYIRLAKKLNLC